MFYVEVDRAATKNEIRDALYEIASEAGRPISEARADKLANKFKKGLFDPELEQVLQYQDPTGETAVANALEEMAA